MTSATTTEYRDPSVIGAEIGQATSAGDIRRLRELANELQQALTKAAQAEVDARNARKNGMLNPLRDRIVQLMERQDGMMDFVRECGGTFSFSYVMPAEGSDQGPVVSINADSKAITSAGPRSPRAVSANGGGGGRGRVYVLPGGAELALSDAFEAIATAEDRAALTTRMESATTDKSRNSAAWAVKSKVVSDAAEAGRLTIKDA